MTEQEINRDFPYYDLDKITFENLFNEKYKVR